MEEFLKFNEDTFREVEIYSNKPELESDVLREALIEVLCETLEVFFFYLWAFS